MAVVSFNFMLKDKFFQRFCAPKSIIFVAMRRTLCFLLYLIPVFFYGQTYLFDTWNSDNELVVSDINAITQDPKGYLWLATEGGGVSRFDGLTFNHFTKEDGLLSDFVSALEWGKDSVLCIGTEKGLCFFNGKEFYQDSLVSQFGERVIDLAFVRDTLFVGFRHMLAYYNDGELIEYGRKDYFKNQILRSFSRFDNQLIVSCDSGTIVVQDFHKLDPRSSSFYFSSGNYSMSYFDGRGELWRFTDGYIFSLDSLSISRGLKDALVWNSEALVFSNESGIQLFESSGPLREINSEQGLNVGQVKCLFEDRFGNLWIGGYEGLAKWVNPNIQNYSEESGLEDERVHAVYTQENRTWFGTNSGIELLDKEGYHQFDEVSAGVVFKIFEDHFGILWFATESGLISFDGSVFRSFGKEQGLDEGFVFDISETANNQLVIGTSASVYIQNDLGFESIFDEDAFGASSIRIDDNNRIWFNPLLGNLSFWENGQITNVNTLGDFSLDEIRISCFDVQMNDQLWIGTLETGLVHWNGEALSKFTEANGLMSNKIDGVLNISETRTWVLFDNGMQSLDFVNGTWRAGKFYDETHGFLGNGSYTNAIFWDGVNENVWAGTRTGAVAISEVNESKSSVQFYAEIRDIDLFFKPNTWIGLEKENWATLPSSLKLNHDQNYLTFHFGAISSGNPKDLYYRYKLKGQDEDWIESNDRYEAIFTNIAHGDYIFQLQVSDNANFENVEQRDFSLKITAPFYKTLWFWAIVVIFIGSVTGWGIRSRLNQLNEKRQLRTALADSERKALRLQMNPHFIFNALDSISGFIFKNEPKLAVKYLNSFAKLMRLTLELSRKKLVPLYSEFNLVKNYLILEQARFNNSFDFEINIDDEIDDYVVMIPPMVIQPNLENAILHGLRHKQGQGRLTVHFLIKGEDLICEIIDDGVGREKALAKKAENPKSHKGLSSNITKERMSLLSKSMERSFLYEIEDLRNKEGQATGTKVVLTFPLIEDDGFEE